MRARIAGTGSSLPALRVTNDDLSRIMDTSDEWIRSRTGIGVRHAAVEETTRSMSVDAARQALEEAGIQRPRFPRTMFCRRFPVKSKAGWVRSTPPLMICVPPVQALFLRSMPRRLISRAACTAQS